MRILLMLLLVGTAMPAAASPRDGDRVRSETRDGPRERSSARRSDDGDRPAARERRSSVEPRASRDDGPRAGRDDGPRLSREDSPRLSSDDAPRAARDDSPRRMIDRSGSDAVRSAIRGDRAANGLARRTERVPDQARPTAELEQAPPGPRMVRAPGRRDRTGDSVADWRIRDRGPGRTPDLVEERADSVTPGTMRDRRQRQLDRFARRGDGDGRNSPAISRTPREGTQPALRTDARPARYSGHRWRDDWRRDRRYDWSDWRRRHRSRFHLSFYFDPFGWNYRRYNVGWRLWPSYYSSRYWLDDPWSYRLPYASPPYRWIRYYEDAILVDTWSGEVVDVIHNFFW